MKGKSIFNGKSPGLSHVDGLLHFVNCVTKAMITDENADYIAILQRKLENQTQLSEVEASTITASRIFRVLSPSSALLHQDASDTNLLVWNCFKYDPSVGYCVGSLKWIAPKNSGAFIILVFNKNRANMYYYTGHTCDIFGKHTERLGGSEELGLPRENDIDLSNVPVDRFPNYIESDTTR